MTMPLHTVRSVCAVPSSEDGSCACSPSLLPDRALADFFLFPRLKAAIKRARFAEVNAIKYRVTAVLPSNPQEVFADCFRKLYERCQTCVVAGGQYFEGQ